MDPAPTEESEELREILDHPLVRAEYPNLEERIRTLFPHLFLGFWNEGKLQTIQLTWSPDIVFHAPLGTDIIRGFENVKAMILGLRSAFAEGRYELEDVVIDHDRVVARITHTGTHVGDFFGLPPTGRKIRIGEVFVFRCAETGPLKMQIVEGWAFLNALHLMQQVGLFPKGNPPQPLLKLVIGLQRIGRKLRRDDKEG
jgi:predicted ester cyclase